ncbi:MAG: bifunctional DNA primase/polymerase [Humidesulfovibrio sp.]|uniref:bifunctional DNA primase/polymerase n=1 Tax=Humidesulfovibrio sp. TaxID=2910988 RepID=UPI00273487CC|nr:bifunctional DNA primase/polymerase [Humidesulfovibrio sp.]MDP2849087.1 bifunctional DNA primase/polymerase [Humidesulfovibrio sp.]
MLAAALDLCTSWRVFPCRDKKPLTPHGLKDASQNKAQVQEWWTRWPDAQIGVPVGENTGSFVLDVDLPDGPASLAALEATHGPLPLTWTATTPSGGIHMHFTLPAGLVLKNSASRLGPGLDIRTEGGYVIAPPTPGYAWTSGKTPRANAPKWLLELLTTPKATTHAAPAQSAATTSYGRAALDSECARVALAPQGSRNQTLNAAAFAVAQLVAGGEVDRSEAEAALLHAALRAGLSETEASKTLASGMAAGEQEPRKPENVNSVNKRPFSSTPSTPSTASTNVNSASTVGPESSTASTVDISALVDEFIEQATGTFTTSELCQWCGLSTREQRVAVSQALLRRIHKSKIERVGARHGNFRRVESECALIDFLASNEPPVDIALPFGLDKLVEMMPGNIALVAGEPNAGKTAFLLNVVRENMHKAQVHYFNSEMGAQELKKRLSKFDMPLSSWTFNAWERTDNFQDAIRPGPGIINIIDFLEVSEDFYRVGGMLKAIHDKLNGALAIVALQKNRGTDLGLGGGRSLEKPRLYLALEPGVVKIVKAKNWRTHTNPNGLQLKFKTVDGCKLLPQGDWHKAPEQSQGRSKAA